MNKSLIILPVSVGAIVALTYYGLLQMMIINLFVPIYLLTKSLKMLALPTDPDDQNKHRQLLEKWVTYGGFVLLDAGMSYISSWLPFHWVYLIMKLLISIWLLSSEGNQKMMYNMFSQIYESSKSELDAVTMIMTEMFGDCMSEVEKMKEKIISFWPNSGKLKKVD